MTLITLTLEQLASDPDWYDDLVDDPSLMAEWTNPDGSRTFIHSGLGMEWIK